MLYISLIFNQSLRLLWVFFIFFFIISFLPVFVTWGNVMLELYFFRQDHSTEFHNSTWFGLSTVVVQSSTRFLSSHNYFYMLSSNTLWSALGEHSEAFTMFIDFHLDLCVLDLVGWKLSVELVVNIFKKLIMGWG